MMKLSDLIERAAEHTEWEHMHETNGCYIRKEHGVVCACVMGMAYLQAGGPMLDCDDPEQGNKVCDFLTQVSVDMEREVPDPIEKEAKHPLWGALIHYNDRKGWTLDQFVTWLRGMGL